MEERRFDDLTRALGRATSRRQVLKGLLGTAAGGILASVGLRAAKPASAAKSCDVDLLQQCQNKAYQTDIECNQRCKAADAGPYFNFGCAAACYYPLQLDLAQCEQQYGCYFNESCCSHTCTQLQRDENNCGACGHVCPPDAVCRGGECHCRWPRVQCANGQCADPNCPPGREFNTSACQCVCEPKSCPDGQTVDPDTCECVTLCVGQENGVQCGANDQRCCAGQCVSTSANNDHCGGCAPCRADQVCQDSTCVCPPGTTDCNGKCVDTDNDVNNCGACGTKCDSGQQCCDGTCKDDCGCQPDQVRCNGTCCPPNQICVDNQCQAPGGCDPACGPDEICCSAGVGLEGESVNGCVSVNDYKVCSVVPINSGGAVRGDWVCCPVDQDCCGGTGYFYNICGGSTVGDQVVCCAAPTKQCGFECCDPSFQTCLIAPDYDGHPGGPSDLGLRCCPAGSGGVLWDGTCCASDQEAAVCKDENGNITGEQCVPQGGFC
jgi:hypothetical protein